VNAIEEFASGKLDVVMLDLLCCAGCIMGPGMTTKDTPLQRRKRLADYVNYRLLSADKEEWNGQMTRLAGLYLGRTFKPKSQNFEILEINGISSILKRMGKLTPQDELNCGACGYPTCREHAIAISRGLAETEMCLPYTIDKLRGALKELEESHQKLQDAQDALMHSEKLASLGQLAAGIAHEVNNPLGVVLMYSHLLADECDPKSSFHSDLKMIAEQADRCKNIVAGLLDFARQNRVILQPTDIVSLVTHGIAATQPDDDIRVVIQNELKDRIVDIDKDQVIQIVMNIANNAYAAMPDGGRLTVRLLEENDSVVLVFVDTGIGIAQKNLRRIFEPFFTTKQIGKGTGLGLAVVYGIVKMHRGEITVESSDDALRGPTGTIFRIKFPRRAQQEESLKKDLRTV
jgi:signal transduction histidine kinase